MNRTYYSNIVSLNKRFLANETINVVKCIKCSGFYCNICVI